MELVDVVLVRVPARDLAAILLALFLTQLVLVPAAPTKGCVNELTGLSPCLPFISSPPNNLSSLPPLCCDVFSSTFNTTDAVCYCYLLRQPSLFGFPLNTTRFILLSSLCSSKNSTSTTTTASLEYLCEAAGSPLPSPASGVPKVTSPAQAPQPQIPRGLSPASPPVSSEAPATLGEAPATLGEAPTTSGIHPVVTPSSANPSQSFSPNLLFFVIGVLALKYH